MNELPALGTDCHTHLFGPAHCFPYAEDRAYTPSDASEEDARQMLGHLGLERIVLVHASVYGDNARLLHGLDVLGNAARAVVVLNGNETSTELLDWKSKGVAGIRVNNVSSSMLSPLAVAENVLTASRRAADLGWHVQVFLQGDDLRAVLERADRLPTALVIDHFGLLGADDHDTRDLLAARLSDGSCWLKLSAAYRLQGNAKAVAGDLIRQFTSANPERLLWGSDWPHPPAHRTPENRLTAQPFREVDTRQLFDDFLAHVVDPDLRRRILVDNPATLYGF